MKTFSERDAELRALREREREIYEEQRRKDVEWLEGVVARKLTVHKPEAVDYRERVRTIVLQGAPYRRVDVACDHCGTELINSTPHSVTASNPPKIRVACIGCGWCGFMTR